MSSSGHVGKSTGNCSQQGVVERRDRDRKTETIREFQLHQRKGVKLNSGCGRLKKKGSIFIISYVKKFNTLTENRVQSLVLYNSNFYVEHLSKEEIWWWN